MNRLSETTSPYLQQHARNPVDWWPWCEQALRLAREQDRPILLSIGYSACHWCHVMAHESFEDAETAELMNQLFVNIKVDREERPDLDRIYQNAHQLLARRPGGWPLTVFLTPSDQIPFFSGTYFPKEPRHGLPAFKDLLVQIHQAYREQPEAIRDQNEALAVALQSLEQATVDYNHTLNDGPLTTARQQLADDFDSRFGGFGDAPKFPHVTGLEHLLQHWAATTLAGRSDAQALEMVTRTLEAMAGGGLQDQLGGGFYRYSVDAYWMIPHFEKMLYDNGLLLALYCDAWQATTNPLLRWTAAQTADWVMREMQAPTGGYYSSLDADSQGEEGRYYLWTRDEVHELLDEPHYSLFAHHYGLDRAANFEGRWHLHTFAGLDILAEQSGLSPQQVQTRLDSARSILLQQREQRPPPGRDEKVLTAWNALMIKGMARAARVLCQPDYLTSAQRALDFIRQNLWCDGRLRASCRGGKAGPAGYLDDYAFLLDALLELLQTRWQQADLELAVQLAEVLLQYFEDVANGGFYFTAGDHERLIQRPRPLSDDAMPAGNAVAARALLRLGHLVGEPRYLQAAERTLRSAWDPLSSFPSAHCGLLLVLEEWLAPPEILVIRGSGEVLQQWQERAGRHYVPHRLCFAIPDNEPGPPLKSYASPAAGSTLAYLCQGTRCLPPITSLDELDKVLTEQEIVA